MVRMAFRILETMPTFFVEEEFESASVENEADGIIKFTGCVFGCIAFAIMSGDANRVEL